MVVDPNGYNLGPFELILEKGQTQKRLIFLPNDPRPSWMALACYRKWRTDAMIC
jgi:hypothetical protein